MSRCEGKQQGNMCALDFHFLLILCFNFVFVQLANYWLKQSSMLDCDINSSMNVFIND